MEKEQKPDRQGYFQSINEILKNLNKEKWLLQSVRWVILKAITKGALIIGRQVLHSLPIFIKIQIIHMLMMTSTIPISTYAVIRVIPRVIDKHHLWNKSTNDEIIIFEWFKSMI